MNKELRKYLSKMWLEIRYGPAYVYARPLDSAGTYRFYFRVYGTKRMRNLVNWLRWSGWKVHVWRPREYARPS